MIDQRVILESEVADDTLRQPCASCDEPIEAGRNWILIFHAGEYRRLHLECERFLSDGIRRPRSKKLCRLAGHLVIAN